MSIMKIDLDLSSHLRILSEALGDGASIWGGGGEIRKFQITPPSPGIKIGNPQTVYVFTYRRPLSPDMDMDTSEYFGRASDAVWAFLKYVGGKAAITIED